jgi:hypothetical protein
VRPLRCRKDISDAITKLFSQLFLPSVDLVSSARFCPPVPRVCCSRANRFVAPKTKASHPLPLDAAGVASNVGNRTVDVPRAKKLPVGGLRARCKGVTRLKRRARRQLQVGREPPRMHGCSGSFISGTRTSPRTEARTAHAAVASWTGQVAAFRKNLQFSLVIDWERPTSSPVQPTEQRGIAPRVVGSGPAGFVWRSSLAHGMHDYLHGALA